MKLNSILGDRKTQVIMHQISRSDCLNWGEIVSSVYFAFNNQIQVQVRIILILTDKSSH